MITPDSINSRVYNPIAGTTPCVLLLYFLIVSAVVVVAIEMRFNIIYRAFGIADIPSPAGFIEIHDDAGASRTIIIITYYYYAYVRCDMFGESPPPEPLSL